jgi:hypothetical protein
MIIPLPSWVTADFLLHVVYGVVLLVILRASRPVYVAFRRRHSGYGVVFNSITGLPVALAGVRLRTRGEHGRIMATAVTDKKGRYSITAKPGEYVVEVVKDGFVFPSRYLRQESSLYDNLLPSAHIIIKDYGVITKNIPADPVGETRQSKVFRWHFQLSSAVQQFLAYGSPFASVFFPLWRGTTSAWALFWVYVAVISVRMLTYRPPRPSFGTIASASTKEPIPHAVVRIFGSKFDKLMETQITGPRGRYAFVVRPGSYYITISKSGYRTVRLKFPNISKDGFALAKDVVMTPLPKTPVSR